MSRNSILLSIIVPVHNIESYIERCITSITEQNIANVEIIIVNDGSTDRTGHICNTIARTNPHISVTHIEHSGVSAARNIGINKSNGKYLMFVDGDDILTNNSIEAICKKINESDFDVITSTKFGRHKYNKNYSMELLNDIEFKKGASAYNLLLKAPFFVPSMCNIICKSSIYNKYNIRFNTELSNNEDIDCALRLLEKINHIGIINEPHYVYKHERKNSASVNFDSKRIKSSLDFITIWSKRAGEEKDLETKLSLLGYIGYQYTILMGSLFVANKDTRKKYTEQIKDFDYLMRHRKSFQGKAILAIYKLFGFVITGRMLAVKIKIGIRS